MKRLMIMSGVVVLAFAVSSTGFAVQNAVVAKEVSSGKTVPGTAQDKTTGMEFVFVKGGCFQMGSAAGDVNKDETPAHKVCVDDFYLGKYEVTRGQWQKITGSLPDGNGRCVEANCPVENIGWNDAAEFIKALNKKSGARYRLPTETEWEYAARSGGKDEIYAGGSNLDAVAWHGGNSGYVSHPVGMKQPNGLGAYDMTGNVEEWCSDWYSADYYRKSPESNPVGPATGDEKVMRGAHYADEDQRWLRTSNRRSDVVGRLETERYGLRLVMPYKMPSGKK